ncbi:hypothetical protein T07_3684 [Trichinella nelsoni]|uniref:Uncharacterized protein n=1 Tax=Trichinella nelsoni TaxID=6336 RepID=A0A0V0RFQ0_9BILA|nr:hypothetical protein T07_3684 [Trichinella nelsoni]
MVVSTTGIQPIWIARLLDRQSKATVDNIKVVNKIHIKLHHDRVAKPSESLRPASYSHISSQVLILSVRGSLSVINCSARPEISRCMIFLLVRETKSTASYGPVSRRISARSFRMKKHCDAVSKRMKTTCDYPHYTFFATHGQPPTLRIAYTTGMQPVWNARLLDRQSKATVDDIKVVNKIHDKLHPDRLPFVAKPSESLRPASYSHISWQMLVLSIRRSLSINRYQQLIRRTSRD